MAIYKQVFVKNGTNAAQIDNTHDWATCFKVRMSELEEARYGACNTLRIVNTAAEDITLSFTWDVQRTDSITIRGGSVFNLTVEDGRNFYGFDIYNANTATDIAAGEVKYTMSRVEQMRE